LQHPVLASLGWVVIFLLIFVPLANYQYKRAVAR
jgi:ABC-2 type transport system permease protein